MTITEIRCAHLLCLSSKAARIFFLTRCRNVDAHMAADILNYGSAGARWFINQSQIHFAPLTESKRISEYMNAKSVDPGAIPRRFVDKAVSFDDTTKRSSRPGVWYPLGRHTWRTSHWETHRYKRNVIKVLWCLVSHHQSITRRQLVYICRRMLTNRTEEEANINHKS